MPAKIFAGLLIDSSVSEKKASFEVMQCRKKRESVFRFQEHSV